MNMEIFQFCVGIILLGVIETLLRFKRKKGKHIARIS